MLKLNNIFNKYNYSEINKINKIKLRNHKNGVQLKDLLYYNFLCTKKNTTKDQVVSHINKLNNTKLTRQAFYIKNKNITVKVYEDMLNNVLKLCNNNPDNDVKLIGIDGTAVSLIKN